MIRGQSLNRRFKKKNIESANVIIKTLAGLTISYQYMSLKIIITDDDAMTLFLHKALIKKSGLSPEPLAFSSATATLSWLDDSKDDETVLVFLDINMPVMSGWEFLDIISTRPYSEKILVVMVTSSVDKADSIKAKQYKQVIDYLEKPVSIAGLGEFQNKLKDLLERT